MERHTIFILLYDCTVSKFVTRKEMEVKNWSGEEYSLDKKISFETPILTSGLCDYNNGYIFVKETIDFLGTAANENNPAHKSIKFKNIASFKTCIS